MSIRIVLAVLLAVVAAAGCGDPQPADSPLVNSIHQPWQPEPFAIEAPIVAALDRACSRTVTPKGLPLAVVDVRGGSRAMLLYAGLRDTNDCTAEIRADGSIDLISQGASGSSDPLGRPVGGAISMSSFGGSGEFTNVIGQAGPAVARVVVRTRTGKLIRASVGPSGWFVAWWPGDDEFLMATGFDAAGAQTGTAE